MGGLTGSMRFKAWENLGEQIADYLAGRIITGQLAPGERVPEAKLARELGVSTGPVREAFHILEGKRLVEQVPRRGARVTVLSRTFIESLYDILIELYALTARKAAENRTRKDMVQLKSALRKIEHCAEKGDTGGYYSAIFNFSLVGLEAAKDPLLAKLIRDFEPNTRRIQFASLSRRKEDIKKNAIFFRDTVRYVEEQNADMACEIIRRYSQNEKEFALNNNKLKI